MKIKDLLLKKLLTQYEFELLSDLLGEAEQVAIECGTTKPEIYNLHNVQQLQRKLGLTPNYPEEWTRD